MRLLVSFLMLISTTPLHALDCDQATTTLEINRCAKAEQEKVEAELDAVYRRVIKMLSDSVAADMKQLDMKERLIAAQRAWIRFRIKDCQAAYAMYQGASIRNLKYISCMQERAQQRIKELGAYIQVDY